MRQRAKWRTAMGLLGVVAAISVSGCAEFDPSNPPSATQTQTLGSVAVTVTVCATEQTASSPAAGACTGSDGNSQTSTNSENMGPSQLFLGFRVPAGTGAPASFVSSSTGPTNSGPQLQFAQNTQYAGELQRLEPAPAGEEWVGYASQYVAYASASGDQNFTATVDFGLPTNTNGSPFSGPFTWQAVVGGRAFESNSVTPGPLNQNAPVDCESSATQLWGLEPATICVDDQAPETLGTDNTLLTRDAGIVPGSPASAVAGTVAGVPFTLAYAGPATPAATFNLAAGTSLPGVSATPSQSTLMPATNSSTPLSVSLPVPANAAPGTYDVTLTGVLTDGEKRTGTAQLTVTAPPPVAAQRTGPIPAARCRVPGLKGKPAGKAAALLHQAHCRLGKVTSRHANARKGTIIAQSPRGGRVLFAGGRVAVTKSLGPARH